MNIKATAPRGKDVGDACQTLILKATPQPCQEIDREILALLYRAIVEKRGALYAALIELYVGEAGKRKRGGIYKRSGKQLPYYGKGSLK